MREFYQCDFDIAGTYDPMLPDAEILRITTEIFEALGWQGRFTIKINHRKILDGIFEVCGVPREQLRTISSAVDKLDKIPWEEVRREMTEDKGLDPKVADRIGEYVVQKGSSALLEKLSADASLMANASAKQGIQDMSLLFDYLEIFGVMPRISLDMSLARGLDYYTGVIYEVITEGSAPATNERQKLQKAAKKEHGKDFDEDRSGDPNVGVGSVAAGGRYDGLVGMFSGKGQIPCVGISFGVERIFSIEKARMERVKALSVRSNEVDVFVMAFGGKGCLKERMEVCKTLWDAGIKVSWFVFPPASECELISSQTEFSWKVKPKLPQQFKVAETGGVPFALILGEDELAQGKVKIKEMGLPPGHPEKDGVLIARDDLVDAVRKRLEVFNMQQADGAADRMGDSMGSLKVNETA